MSKCVLYYWNTLVSQCYVQTAESVSSQYTAVWAINDFN